MFSAGVKGTVLSDFCTTIRFRKARRVQTNWTCAQDRFLFLNEISRASKVRGPHTQAIHTRETKQHLHLHTHLAPQKAKAYVHMTGRKRPRGRPEGTKKKKKGARTGGRVVAREPAKPDVAQTAERVDLPLHGDPCYEGDQTATAAVAVMTARVQETSHMTEPQNDRIGAAGKSARMQSSGEVW